MKSTWVAAAAAALIAIGAIGAVGGPMPPTKATDAVPDSSALTEDVVTLAVAYRFDAQDLIPLTDASLLPAPRGSVTARWGAYRGWAVVEFGGLDRLPGAGLCVGTSAIDPASGLVGHVSYDSTEPGACDDAGAGAVPSAEGDHGARICDGTLAYVTTIPAEAGGPLIATLVVFPGDGTGVGLSGRLEDRGPLRELDGSSVDCAPLPPAREPRPAPSVAPPTPAPAPAPPSSGLVPAAERAPAPSARPVAECALPQGDRIGDVHATPAGPYLVAHPRTPDASTPTIIFLPGGPGGYRAARRAWETFFSEGAGFEAFRVVIPYSIDGELMGEAMRTFELPGQGHVPGPRFESRILLEFWESRE